MVRIEDSVEIDAPVSRVWAVTLDVEAWPRIIAANFKSVAWLTGSPVRVGSQARIEQPGQSEKVWTVTKLEQERYFAWSTRAMGMSMTGTHQLSPTPSGGTRNTVGVDLEGWFASVAGVLLKHPIQQALMRENAAFKAEAERQHCDRTQRP
jgi:uncharacterized membrane protein